MAVCFVVSPAVVAYRSIDPPRYEAGELSGGSLASKALATSGDLPNIREGSAFMKNEGSTLNLWCFVHGQI